MFHFHRDILECNNCGIIYRSRQFWYGNPEVITSSIQMFVSTGIFWSAITVVLYTEVNSSGMAIQKLLLVVYKCLFLQGYSRVQ